MAASAIETDRSERWHYLSLSAVAVLLSTTALAYYYHSGAILLYGDAVAHINIARRVFDSRTPAWFQLGTVWLPLPHLLQIPFISNDWLWRSGVGASLPSMLAYIAGTLGVFRLVRGLASRGAAWIAALIYALNPNLLYLEATAMGEALYLALFVWTLVFFSEFAREAREQPQRARGSLEKCGLALSASMLVRYDAWFFAPVLSLAVLMVAEKQSMVPGPIRRGIVNFLLLGSLTAALWLAYNRAAYGNALEFATGPYSAHAIQERSRTPTFPSYPGEGSPRTAALYFLKVSRLNLGQGPAASLLFMVAFVALLSAVYFSRKFLPWTLLWIPVVFYTLSISWGSVPIYFPDWYPFSYYNVRYGLQTLPAVAVFVGVGYEFLSKVIPARLAALGTAALVIASYGSVWRNIPICLREAEANGRARMEFDHRLASELGKLPASATLMMDCGAHSGAIQDAGIHFRRVLRESNPPYWEIALTQPAQSADYIIAFPGDDVSRAVHLFPAGLEPVARVDAPQGLRAVIYRSVHE